MELWSFRSGLIYYDSNLPEEIAFDCEMEDDGIGYKSKDLKYNLSQTRNQGDCVKLYIEIDNDIVVQKGGVTNATNYAVGLFGQSIVLYDNEDILMSINEIKAWNVPSPYNSTSSSGMLGAFQGNINAINGDLVREERNIAPLKLVLFCLLFVCKILIMLRHKSDLPASIRQKTTAF